MSQSPDSALRVQRYENGWEIINRMIREDMSWGGQERKCFHVQCEDGTFADMSGASELDFLDDGRALCVADFDEDGRPDLALRNRTAPQMRLLRNVWPHPGPVVWLWLEGKESNRDALGARVTMHAGKRIKVKEVTAGSAFLSQSSRWLTFGLGDDTPGATFEVRWPSGRQQNLGVLQPGHRYRCREGESPTASPLRSATPAAAPPVPLPEPRQAPVQAASSSVATWLLEPVAAPNLALAALTPRAIAGTRIALAGRLGKPRLLHFLSLHCPACASEVDNVRDAEQALARAGSELVHVLVDLGASSTELQDFTASARYTSPVLQADGPTLAAYNVLHRHIWNQRRDLAVPTSFLLDEHGQVVKVYRGGVPAELLAADARRIPRQPAERLALALPYPGKVLRSTFHRDPLSLGNAYFEAGLVDLASATFESALARQADDADSLFNYAMALADGGKLDLAAQAYERVLAAAPSLDDARNNLGILRAKAGDREGALAMFKAIVERNPAHSEAVLNLSNALVESQNISAAMAVCRRALEHDQESAPFHRQLGYTLYQAGDRQGALQSYERALALDPGDVETSLGLAILLFAVGDPARSLQVSQQALARSPGDAGLLNTLGMAQDAVGETENALNSLTQAIAANPDFDRAYTNLARILVRQGRQGEADEVLRKLRERMPNHPAVQTPPGKQ